MTTAKLGEAKCAVFCHQRFTVKDSTHSQYLRDCSNYIGIGAETAEICRFFTHRQISYRRSGVVALLVVHRTTDQFAMYTSTADLPPLPTSELIIKMLLQIWKELWTQFIVVPKLS